MIRRYLCLLEQLGHLLQHAPHVPPFSTTTAELDARFGEPFELLRRWTPRSYESREGKELMNEWKMKG